MSSWEIGWTIGIGLLVVVAVLLVLMILGAARAATKAEAIDAAFADVRDNTEGLWQLDVTNRTATRIVASATAAREYLTSAGGGQ